MNDSFGQGSTQPGSGSHSDDAILLASSCPKKPAGRKKFKETRHPVYRGVRQRNGNRWVCEVRTPTNSRIWLGSYPTAEMAARAHDVAALAFKGQSACLNFADSAWRLPVPVSTDSMDIQRAAAEAAELFHPPESDNPTQDDGNEAVMTQGQMSIDCEGVPETSSSSAYMDEEAVFNMPGLMDNMAEALMLPPPPNKLGWDDTENECEVSLWNY